MLYEVITSYSEKLKIADSIDILLGKKVEGIICLGGNFDKSLENKIDRITSYNVCYTKLLREALAPAGGDHQGQGAAPGKSVGGRLRVGGCHGREPRALYRRGQEAIIKAPWRITWCSI